MSEKSQDKKANTEMKVIQTTTNTTEQTTNSKDTYTAGLVIGILSIVFSVFFALAGNILGVIGIILNSIKYKNYKTTAGLILSIIGFIISFFNIILGIIMIIFMFGEL